MPSATHANIRWMNRLDLAWAAGFFDAEGSFAKGGGYPKAVIANTDQLLLRRFRTTLGLGRIAGPYTRHTASFRRRPQWFCQINGRSKTQSVAAMLWPWLSPPKRRQACRVLAGKDINSDWPPLTNRRESLAWAAGFFDGEGCFSRSKGALTARITNTDVDALGRFREIVGLGAIYGPYDPPPTTFGTKPHFVFAVSGFERVQALLGQLWFRLGAAKRAKAVEILTHHRTTYACGHIRGPELWHKHCPTCFRPGPKPRGR